MTAAAFILLLIASLCKALMNAGYVNEKKRYQAVYYNEDTKLYHIYQGIMHGFYFVVINVLIVVPTQGLSWDSMLTVLINTTAMHILLAWIFFEFILYLKTGIPLLYTSSLNVIDKQFYNLPDIPKLITGERTNANCLADGYKLTAKILFGSLSIYALIWL